MVVNGSKQKAATLRGSQLPETAPVLLTIKQTMQRLGYSRPTIAKLIARGDLKAKRLGRTVRVTADSVKQFADS